MESNYSFLNDTLAIHEIRKHKWLESEKQGQEIGFATAALDWIKKYGQQWYLFRAEHQQGADPFSEKRQFRRFERKFPLRIKISDKQIECQTDNINLLGLACTIPESISTDETADVTILFPKPESPRNPENRIRFRTRIARVSNPTAAVQGCPCNVFLPFPERIKDFIREHSEMLNN
jgi:hypothetical protein